VIELGSIPLVSTTFPHPILDFHFCNVDSWKVFHSPQVGHLPVHFGDVVAQEEQIYIGMDYYRDY
jgi:hypothetical protein